MAHKTMNEITRDSIDPFVETFNIAAIGGFFARQWWLLMVAATVFGIGAAAFVFTTQPRYVALASVLLESRRVQIFQQNSAAEPNLDLPRTETQVEIIASFEVAAAVVEKLKLG